QPAHIHEGACEKPGKVVYPLTSVVDGASETIIETTLKDLKDNLPLSLNVHKSQAELAVYTACGELK
ncbi:MAG: hypothetical protein AAB966_04665, partial [Patescibacteria group bacterium]